jgi:hypothetical protein
MEMKGRRTHVGHLSEVIDAQRQGIVLLQMLDHFADLLHLASYHTQLSNFFLTS